MFDAICSRRSDYFSAEFEALGAEGLILLASNCFEALGGGRKARRSRKRLPVVRLSLLIKPFGSLGLFNQLPGSHLLTAPVHPP
jgi:hypothetical protein